MDSSDDDPDDQNPSTFDFFNVIQPGIMDGTESFYDTVNTKMPHSLCG